MSAAWSAGYVKSPPETKSVVSDLSLNWVIRRNSPNDAVHSISQAHWACCSTWDWTKSTARSGSTPMASSSWAVSSVVRVSSSGSCGVVRACRSTTE